MARTFHAAVSAVVTLACCLALLTPSSAQAAVAQVKQPNWVELTPQQQVILAPLAAEWDKLEPYRRKKWVGIAHRYPSMSMEEQQRVELRMKQWVALTPEQRKIAREKYKSLRNSPAANRAVVRQKWEEYKELPEEERRRLSELARHKSSSPKSAAGKSKPSPVTKRVAPSAQTTAASVSVSPPPAPAPGTAAVPPASASVNAPLTTPR